MSVGIGQIALLQVADARLTGAHSDLKLLSEGAPSRLTDCAREWHVSVEVLLGSIHEYLSNIEGER